jgi:hypothetical protein
MQMHQHKSIVDDRDRYITNDVVLSYRFRNNYALRSSARYNASDARFMSYGAELQKRIAKRFFCFPKKHTVK